MQGNHRVSISEGIHWQALGMIHQKGLRLRQGLCWRGKGALKYCSLKGFEVV
jgi:hypothetical protein